MKSLILFQSKLNRLDFHKQEYINNKIDKYVHKFYFLIAPIKSKHQYQLQKKPERELLLLFFP